MLFIDTLGGWKRLYGTLNDFVGIQTAHTASPSPCHRPLLWLILEPRMVTTTGTQGQRQISSDFELWNQNSKLKSTYLGELSPDFKKISVYELRMDGIYRFVKKSIRTQYLCIFFQCKMCTTFVLIARLLGTPPLRMSVRMPNSQPSLQLWTKISSRWESFGATSVWKLQIRKDFEWLQKLHKRISFVNSTS